MSSTGHYQSSTSCTFADDMITVTAGPGSGSGVCAAREEHVYNQRSFANDCRTVHKWTMWCGWRHLSKRCNQIIQDMGMGGQGSLPSPVGRHTV